MLNDVKAYAHKVWLAGLGAYAKAGKEGSEYFKDLVKAGEGVEKQGKQLVNAQVEAANSQITDQLQSVKSSVFGVKEKLKCSSTRSKKPSTIV